MTLKTERGSQWNKKWFFEKSIKFDKPLTNVTNKDTNDAYQECNGGCDGWFYMTTWQAQESPLLLGVWEGISGEDSVRSGDWAHRLGAQRYRKMKEGDFALSLIPSHVHLLPSDIGAAGCSSAFGLGTELSHQLWPPGVSSFLTAGCGVNSYIYLYTYCSSVCRTLTNNRGHCKGTKWMLQTMLINSTTLKKWINYLKIKIYQNLSKMK